MELETTSAFQGFGITKPCAQRVAAVLLFWFETVVSDYLRQLRKSRIPCPATQMKSTLLQGIKNKAELSIPSFKIDIYSQKESFACRNTHPDTHLCHSPHLTPCRLSAGLCMEQVSLDRGSMLPRSEIFMARDCKLDFPVSPMPTEKYAQGFDAHIKTPREPLTCAGLAFSSQLGILSHAPTAAVFCWER